MRKVSIIGILLGSTSLVHAAPIDGEIQVNSENGHAYIWFSGPLYWEDANNFADQYSTQVDGITLSDWHLATISNATENAFIFETVMDNGTSDASFIGGIITDGSLFNWQWVTGEPFVYSNFAAGTAMTLVRENVIHMGGQWGPFWNDEDGPGSPSIVRNPFVIEHPDNSSGVIRIGPARYYPTQSSTGSVYQLFGRDSPTDDVWYDIGDAVLGTGSLIYGFETGVGADWLPSRAWEISEHTDGFSLSFDGIDDIAFLFHDPLLNLDSGMTLEAWVKPAPSGSGGTVLAKAASTALSCYRLGVDPTGQPVFQVFDPAGSPFVNLLGGTVVPNDQWTHLAATYDGVIAKLLMNGVLASSDQASGSVRVSSLSPFSLGGILSADPFAGEVDDIRLWNHARDEQSILDNHETPLAGTEPGLTAYWKLKEPGSQVVLDSTSNSLDLTRGDSSSPDSFDPDWFSESFPGQSVFASLFEFGTPWFSVHWNTRAGKSYCLETAPDLVTGPWAALVEDIQGTGGVLKYFESPAEDPPAGRYYRVVTTPGAPPQ